MNPEDLRGAGVVVNVTKTGSFLFNAAMRFWIDCIL